MKTFFSSLLCLLLFSGCSLPGISTDGGVYKTENNGMTWTQRTRVIVNSKERSIGSSNVLSLQIDPSNANVLYLGTAESGAYLSRDGGNIWVPFFTNQGAVHSLVPHPQDSRTIFAIIKEKIYRTQDGGESWHLIYTNNGGASVTGIAVDHFERNIVYGATSNGVLLSSKDYGTSWSSLHDFQDYIEKVIVNPKDSRIVYVASTSNGIFRSSDKGGNWKTITESLSQYNGSRTYRDLEFDITQRDGLLYASDYGIFRSFDGGNTWSSLSLLTPPGTYIDAVLNHPLDARRLFYTTTTSFYQSNDGGRSWQISLLPTSRIAADLRSDARNPDAIYLSARKPKK